MIRTNCDEAGDYVVPNVLSPRDLVSRPDNMDKTVLSSFHGDMRGHRRVIASTSQCLIGAKAMFSRALACSTPTLCARRHCTAHGHEQQTRYRPHCKRRDNISNLCYMKFFPNV